MGLKVSQLRTLLEGLDDECILYFEDEEAYTELGAAVYFRDEHCISLVPSDAQIQYETEFPNKLEVVGDPTSVEVVPPGLPADDDMVSVAEVSAIPTHEGLAYDESEIPL